MGRPLWPPRSFCPRTWLDIPRPTPRPRDRGERGRYHRYNATRGSRMTGSGSSVCRGRSDARVEQRWLLTRRRVVAPAVTRGLLVLTQLSCRGPTTSLCCECRPARASRLLALRPTFSAHSLRNE